ncbi:MAG: DUF120 domain-containing protein [Candidatus Thermoplasmatota archaeon]
MKPYLLQTLKELGLLGAMRNRVEISSQELAARLDASQQTASRYLLELEKVGMISREFGIKKQLIQITQAGADILADEYALYKQIFDLPNKIVFKGKVVSGLGEGKYYTEQKGYAVQFQNKLQFLPYPGTLNVEIDSVERNKLRLLKNCKGITIDEFKTENRTFGGGICFHAMINDIPGAIILPKRSHYSNILELISKDNLREKLRLLDGDDVTVIIFLEGCEEKL